MTKKEAIAVIGFIQMLPKFWSYSADSMIQNLNERQFEDYKALVISLVEEE